MEYVNKIKLLRARKLAEDSGKAGDEITIRENYLAMGGLITGEEVGSEEVAAPKKQRKAKTEEAE